MLALIDRLQRIPPKPRGTDGVWPRIRSWAISCVTNWIGLCVRSFDIGRISGTVCFVIPRSFSMIGIKAFRDSLLHEIQRFPVTSWNIYICLLNGIIIIKSHHKRIRRKFKNNEGSEKIAREDKPQYSQVAILKGMLARRGAYILFSSEQTDWKLECMFYVFWSAKATCV